MKNLMQSSPNKYFDITQRKHGIKVENLNYA